MFVLLSSVATKDKLKMIQKSVVAIRKICVLSQIIRSTKIRRDASIYRSEE